MLGKLTLAQTYWLNFKGCLIPPKFGNFKAAVKAAREAALKRKAEASTPT